jgi:hypothetical protein
MPHSPYLLRITPKELNFPPPLNRVITNTLKLHNMSTDYHIAYKVKTTAPQRYCVRPNTGVLPPGETAEVQVLLNYIKDAPSRLDVKDKFQIQSIILKDPNVDIKEMWAKATDDQIVKQKIKARFSVPTTSGVAGKTVPSERLSDDGQREKPSLRTSTGIEESSLEQPQQLIAGVQSTIPLQQQQHEPSPASKPSLPLTPTAQTPAPSPPPSPAQPAREERHQQQPTTTEGKTLTLLEAHTGLRKALDQVVSLTDERDALQRQNTLLTEQIKTISSKLQASQETSVGLRQRSPSSTTTTTDKIHPATPHPPLTVTDGQLQILLLLLFVAVLSFIVGRWTA